MGSKQGWLVVATALMLGAIVPASAGADELDVMAQEAVSSDGVLQVGGDAEFLALSPKDQDEILRSIWIVLSEKNASLSRIEVVQPADAKPLLEYDAASGLSTAASAETP